jgi:hypothetical protein
MTLDESTNYPKLATRLTCLGVIALALSVIVALLPLLSSAYRHIEHHLNARLVVAACGIIIGFTLIIVGLVGIARWHKEGEVRRRAESGSETKRPPGYPKPLQRVAGRIKAALQMSVGLYALGWLGWSFCFSHRLHNCAPLPPAHGGVSRFTGDHLCYLIPQSAVVFQVVADALAAATVIQLAYTLFTPGPDEALDPVLLALATVFLFEIGQINQFQWQDGVTILLYAAGLGLLFAVRVFLAPDEDNPPTLWWWRRRPYRWRPPARPR